MDEPHLDEGECVISENDTLVVLGASYDSVSDAEVDYEAVKQSDSRTELAKKYP